MAAEKPAEDGAATVTGEVDVAAAPAGQIDTIAGFGTETTAETSPKRPLDDAVATDTADPAFNARMAALARQKELFLRRAAPGVC